MITLYVISLSGTHCTADYNKWMKFIHTLQIIGWITTSKYSLVWSHQQNDNIKNDHIKHHPMFQLTCPVWMSLIKYSTTAVRTPASAQITPT